MSAITIILFFVMTLCAVGDMKVMKNLQFVSVIDKNITPLILGGKRAVIDESPFMALYVERADLGGVSLICGASILSERFVLSAGHCYDSGDNVPQFVLVGTDTLDSINSRQLYTIEKITIHPNYNEITLDYDVLVIKLCGKLEFNTKVQPVKMADSKFVIKEGAILDTLGFGLTESKSSSNYLLKVRVPYIRPERCAVAYNNQLTERMICAGEEGKDSCFGDSGGPLVYGNILVGVVSFGMKCGDPLNPGVYASVSRLREFIDFVMNNS